LPYYAIFDPSHLLSQETLLTYRLVGGSYQLTEPGPWPTIGLGLRLWEGEVEGFHDLWLRWCDANGELIPTAAERAEQDAARVKQAEERAQQEAERANQAEERARLLEAELRRLKGQPPA
jgi:hypothetical protein